MILFLFDVSGGGKTTIGQLFSSRLGWRFEDGAEYHSVANRQKMESGAPLTDDGRDRWLNVLHLRMQEFMSNDENAILVCSALSKNTATC
jgi:gluconokinase